MGDSTETMSGRGRLRRRTASRRAAMVVGAVLVVAGVALAPYVVATPNPRIDYRAQYDAAAEAVQPEGENSWPRWREFSDRVQAERVAGSPGPIFGTVSWHTYILSLTNGSLDDPRHARGLEMIARAGPLLDEYEAIAALPGFLVEHDGPSADSTLIGPIGGCFAAVQGIRRGVFLNTMSLRVAAARGDWALVERRLRAGTMAARQLTLDPTSVSWLIGQSGASFTLFELRASIVEYAPGSRVCDQLHATLSGVEPFAAPISHALTLDYLLPLDMIQRGWGSWGWGGGAAALWADPVASVATPSLLDRLANVRAVAAPSRMAALRGVREQSQRLQQWVGTPPLLRQDLPRPPEQSDPRWIDLFSEKSAGAGTSGRTVMSCVQTFERGISERAATLLLLRLARHRALAGGAWPATLGDAASTAETLDPVTGRPFEYAPPRDAAGLPSLRLPRVWADLIGKDEDWEGFEMVHPRPEIDDSISRELKDAHEKDGVPYPGDG